jgi:hypothetical protein
MNDSIDSQIFARITNQGTGWCFTPRDFLDLGPSTAIWATLSRLQKNGTVRRLGKGLYDFPRVHPELGLLSPTPEAVAQAIAERDGSRLQPSGAYAANVLGLSEQVPAQVVFLTSGPDRKVKIGNREIILKNTVPRNLATAGRISGTVIQALRHIGEKHITQTHIKHLKNKLSKADRDQLWKDRVNAPVWLHSFLKEIAGDADA